MEVPDAPPSFLENLFKEVEYTLEEQAAITAYYKQHGPSDTRQFEDYIRQTLTPYSNSLQELVEEYQMNKRGKLGLGSTGIGGR